MPEVHSRNVHSIINLHIILFVMFSNRVCVSTTNSLVLSELQSAGSVSTSIDVHGLKWTLVFEWDEEGGRVGYKLGLDQPPDCMVGVAVEALSVVESSTARRTRTLPCFLTCTDAQHSIWWRILVRPSEMDLLIEERKLKITIFLEVFKPLKFRNISPGAIYETVTPDQCVAILGIDHQGSILALRNLSVLSPGLEQWCVYAFRPFLPDCGIIMTLINMRQSRFKGSGFDRDNKRLAVTQIYDNNSSLQVDIFDWGTGDRATRTYELQDQDLKWSAATPHKQGWICIASGVRHEPDVALATAHFRFWLLDDGNLKLLAELVTGQRAHSAASVNSHFYCLVSTYECKCFLWMSLWEQPDVWQPFELAPSLDFHDYAICYEWGHLLLVGMLFSGPGLKNNPHRQDAIFKLRLEGADCLVEPYMIVPKGVRHWRFGNDGLVALIREQNVIQYFGTQPATLKNRAVLDVAKLLGDCGDVDTEWRHKLTRLLKQSTNFFLT